MRILLWASYAKAEIAAALAAVAKDELVIIDDIAGLKRAAPDATALFCQDFIYTAEVASLMRAEARALKWIQLLTAGYDNALLHGVPEGTILTNAGDAYSPAVATHAVTLLLALQRRLPAVLVQQEQRIWDRRFTPPLVTPADATVAIVGFGHIGREIARLLRPFGARIVSVSRSGKPDPLADEAERAHNLAAVLARADAVVLALALSPQTHHLIGARELALLKRDAVLVNIARGAIVDHVALAAALKSGALAGAGLDVTEPEPLPREHPLWDAPNLILTPHVAGSCGALGFERLARMAAGNLRRFLAGEMPEHRVDLAR